MAKKTTMSDIAAELGISTVTVSKALSGQKGVSEEMRQRIIDLAEERGLYPKYSLMDQLLYFASLKGLSTDVAMERIKYWGGRLKVTEYLFPERKKGKKFKPTLAEQLSKGNQQKIQLMAALISDPEFLILDEPLSGLDPVNTDLFKSVIREEIDKQKYIILSSHQMPVIEEFCEDITKYGDTLAQTYVTVNPGQMAIFFPQDGHAPCISGEAEIKKAIFKIKN